MSAAAYYPLEWTQGNTYDPVITFKSGYLPFPLTGGSVVFRVTDATETEVLRIDTDTVDSGVEISDAANGEVTFNVSYTVTRDAPTRGLNYSIEWRFDPDVQKTLMYGPMNVRRDANDDV